MNLIYHHLIGNESSGRYGSFGINIDVAASVPPDWHDSAIINAAYEAVHMIETAVRTVIVRNNPEAQATRKAEREQIMSLFSSPILVEEIPNGYCSDWCCKHLPWFLITTDIGRFKIGWRKRVIEIDWTGTWNIKTGNDLFAKEDVTKGERFIHAWTIEKAREYIETIIKTAIYRMSS